MANPTHQNPAVGPGEYNAPWEESFGRVYTPFEEFLHRQTTSGLLLMGMAVIALFIANSGLAPLYEKILSTYAIVGIGEWTVNMSIHHWINDALMALFFFVVGLELKREFRSASWLTPRTPCCPSQPPSAVWLFRP